MEPIRLCYIEKQYVHQLHHSIPKGDVFNRPASFEGFLKILLNPLAELYFFPEFNYTIMAENDIGKHGVSGTPYSQINGCNGRIQRNQSDAGLYPYYYPSFEPSIDVSHIFLEQTLSILSVYNTTTATKYTNLMNSFGNLSWDVYLIVIMATLIMSWVIRRKSPSIRTQSIRTSDIAFSHLSNIVTFDIEDWFPRTISILLSFLLFFVINGYSNFIKTDIVVVEKPFLIETYDDIFNNLDKLTPQFAMQDNIHFFKNAKPGSVERQIWDRIKGRSIISRKLADRLGNMTLGKMVELQVSDKAKFIAAAFCGIKTTGLFNPGLDISKDLFPWISQDPSTEVIHFGFPLKAGVNPRFKGKLMTRLQRVMEGGLEWRFLRSMMDLISITFNADVRDDYRTCVESANGKLQMPEIGHHPFKLKNYERVATYFLLFLYVCFAVIGVEVLIQKKQGKVAPTQASNDNNDVNVSKSD